MAIIATSGDFPRREAGPSRTGRIDACTKSTHKIDKNRHRRTRSRPGQAICGSRLLYWGNRQNRAGDSSAIRSEINRKM